MEQVTSELAHLAAYHASSPAIVFPHQAMNPVEPHNNEVKLPAPNQKLGFPIQPTNRHLIKRGLTDFIAGSVVSNVVETLLDRFWPNPTISNLQEKELLMDQKLEALNARRNFTRLQLKASTEGQEVLVNLVRNNIAAVDAITTVYPQLAIVAADLVAQHHLLGSYLDQLKVSFRMRRPNLQLLYILFGLEVILEVNPESFREDSIRLIAPGTNLLQVEFVARRRNNEAQIFQVHTFRVWANMLTPRPTVLDYSGPRLVLRNAANNCIKAITNLQGNYVTARCQEANYEDQQLSNWRETPETDKIFATEVIEAWPLIMVNCHPDVITIGQETEQCPPFAFELDYMTKFETSNYDHSPSVMEVTVMNFEPTTN